MSAVYQGQPACHTEINKLMSHGFWQSIFYTLSTKYPQNVCQRPTRSFCATLSFKTKGWNFRKINGG